MHPGFATLSSNGLPHMYVRGVSPSKIRLVCRNMTQYPPISSQCQKSEYHSDRRNRYPYSQLREMMEVMRAKLWNQDHDVVLFQLWLFLCAINFQVSSQGSSLLIIWSYDRSFAMLFKLPQRDLFANRIRFLV